MPDQYLKIPITLGQTFIERPNVIIYTTNEELLFLEAPHLDCCDDLKYIYVCIYVYIYMYIDKIRCTAGERIISEQEKQQIRFYT